MGEETNINSNNMSDMDTYARLLMVSDPLRDPVIRQVIRELDLPPGSKGLDAGCGIGLQTVLLAETVGPGGHVTGLDLSPDFLVHARTIAKKYGLSEQVTFQQGDVYHLPFENNSFDWAWSVDCVGYAPMKPLPALKELVRVVKPGGMVVLLMWSSQKLLPGYPRLEARLNATAAGIAPFVQGKKPEMHFMRLLGWLGKAGLQTPEAQTFVGNVCAPLRDEIRSALTALFDMRWGEAESEVSPKDWKLYQRLCQPGSKDFILNLPDYYAFFTYSLFRGKVEK
ncbi:MAG: class I SAM-dependent methyltransferase [Candidatus Aminicenantes bacterium]|jgi:demethylmenaquinone methyltransferase/2-methoxy-6-polyprenyl-1,4-benzoquinol methylase